MSAKPRGHCIIVNIINYRKMSAKKRHGAEYDAEKLKKLFKQLGFEVDVREDVTKGVSI